MTPALPRTRLIGRAAGHDCRVGLFTAIALLPQASIRQAGAVMARCWAQKAVPAHTEVLGRAPHWCSVMWFGLSRFEPTSRGQRLCLNLAPEQSETASLTFRSFLCKIVQECHVVLAITVEFNTISLKGPANPKLSIRHRPPPRVWPGIALIPGRLSTTSRLMRESVALN